VLLTHLASFDLTGVIEFGNSPFGKWKYAHPSGTVGVANIALVARGDRFTIFGGRKKE
jgi:hypothetical protein